MCVCIYMCVCVCNGILLSHKKNEILPFGTTQMDLEDIMLNEISQTKKNKYCMISLVCQILENKKNEET